MGPLNPLIRISRRTLCQPLAITRRMSSRNINPLKVQVLSHIANLIDCLVNIKDETGEFLMTLEDGRVIDTKGWNDWEVRISFKPMEVY